MTDRAESAAADKDSLRRRLRARRAERSDAQLAEHGNSVSERLIEAYSSARERRPGSAGLIAYLPMPGEPSPLVAMTALCERGVPVWVPVIQPARQLGFAPWRPGISTTAHPALAIEEPTEGVQSADSVLGAAMMIVPALALTVSGARLGQGGGYYDRLLARWEDAGSDLPWRVGLVFPDEVLDDAAIPVLAHDVQLDAVIS
ncbi:5-formyltetrahydrofolate cyclo-ligase [Haematomicrobium sanguinis]|uniref:5-formyltetrahydrofolate cyclo-ligase n=1 Tax=Haematomicrobium sanguinis TaxID=479106 RepID=UPI0004788B21|nr:5-formyltetrahydrofolate cyclo-ligase [Haematomicrobium sanguinis]